MSKKSRLLSRVSVSEPKKKAKHASKHPFFVPVLVFLMLFFISSIGLVVSGGQTVEPSDAKVVNLSIDGEAQIVPTRAETVEELLERLDLQLSEDDILEPAAETEIIGNDFDVNIYKARPVTIIDEDKTVSAVSARQTPREITKDAGVEVYPEDNLEVATSEEVISEGIITGQRIVIDRATLVKLNLYGTNYDVRTHAETVGELLEERDISFDQSSVLPAPDSPINPEEVIFVTDPGKEIAVIEEAIPQDEETVDDPNLEAGETRVREEGRPGKKVVVYEVTGAGQSRTPLQEVIVVTPVTRVVAVGSKVVIIDPSDSVRIGEQMAAQRGWSGSQWRCLYQLWQRESGWSATAGNPTTGAYGIPQSLPGSKMASSGSDWRTNPATQIDWGMGYIAGRYGNPCGAWNYFLSNNWY